MSHKSLPGGFLSILPKSVQISDFLKQNSFVLSKHIFSKFDNRNLKCCRAEGVVVAGFPFCAFCGFRVAGLPSIRVADRPISQSSDVTIARVVHLRFSACPIERSHVAQRSSGRLPFDFAKKCSNIRFCEREFGRLEPAYIFEF
jgi:hypothetical protein